MNPRWTVASALAVLAIGLACGGGARVALPPLPPPADHGAHSPECMIDEVEPALASTQESVAVEVDTGPGYSVESFTWPDGTPVRFEQGGCNHFNMTLTVGLAAPPADVYANALAQLDRVAFTSDSMLRTKLRESGRLGSDGTFDCGDAYCRVDVIEDADGVRIVIGYDFAL